MQLSCWFWLILPFSGDIWFMCSAGLATWLVRIKQTGFSNCWKSFFLLLPGKDNWAIQIRLQHMVQDRQNNLPSICLSLPASCRVRGWAGGPNVEHSLIWAVCHEKWLLLFALHKLKATAKYRSNKLHCRCWSKTEFAGLILRFWQGKESALNFNGSTVSTHKTPS